MAWTMIEQTVLTSSQASVTLGSGGTIPQTYKTLKVIISSRDDLTNQSFLVEFNGSTANRSGRALTGNGSAASSRTDTTFITVETGTGDTASTFASTEITIPNYTGSTNKPASVDGVTENNATLGLQWLSAWLWSNTAAITSLVFRPNGTGNFVSGSTFTLYGLA